MFHENLKGRVAVITGGGGVLCSGFAKDLAKLGVKVAVLDLREEAAQKVVDEITAEGGIALAEKVLQTLEEKESNFKPIYEDNLSLKEKIETIAKEIYGADGVNYAGNAMTQINRLEALGFGNLPICMAKTQYSLSDNEKLLGRPSGFSITVREAYVSAGAGFIVVLTGNVMTMPGLPKKPAAYSIDVDENGKITGLF